MRYLHFIYFVPCQSCRFFSSEALFNWLQIIWSVSKRAPIYNSTEIPWNVSTLTFMEASLKDGSACEKILLPVTQTHHRKGIFFPKSHLKTENIHETSSLLLPPKEESILMRHRDTSGQRNKTMHFFQRCTICHQGGTICQPEWGGVCRSSVDPILAGTGKLYISWTK